MSEGREEFPDAEPEPAGRFERVGDAMAGWARRWVPDPFVLALGLSVVVILAGAAMLATTDPVRLAPPMITTGWAALWRSTRVWAEGLATPEGLAFALQMCLVLVTGHAMALSPPVQRLIRALAGVPRSAPAASVLVALVACAAGLIHWGLGAIAGALLAREIGRNAPARDLSVHYPLLGAAAYSGMAVWHGGLSGSAPLKVAEGGRLALADTLGSALNLATCSAMVAVIALLYWLLTPRDPERLSPPDPDALAPVPERNAAAVDSPVAWLQESPWVGRILGTAALGVLLASVVSGERTLDINSVNLGFFSIGLCLQGSLRHYTEAVADGARGAGAIIIQFPIYYGILAVLKASGIAAALSSLFATIAGSQSFPVLTFLSAGLVNLFVPSGGGQWAVQSDIVLTAGAALSVPPHVTVMAFSYGDAWTNMLQPFWALPLLGIMGLKARDIIGYTALVFLALGLVVPAMLLVLS